MALALFSRRSTRERRLVAKVAHLERALTMPIIQDHQQFVGFGDSANAEKTLKAVRGTAATAMRVTKQRVQGLERGVFSRRLVNGEFVDSRLVDHRLSRLMQNPTMNPDGSMSHTAQQLFGLIVTLYEALGEAYLFILRDGLGVPMRLQMAKPGTVSPVVSGGVVSGYRLSGSFGSASLPMLAPTDVIRIWDPDPFDQFEARGIMGKHVISIETEQFNKLRWHGYFQNDAMPQFAFENADKTAQMPDEELEEQAARKFTERFRRLRGKWRGTGAYVKPGWVINQLSSEADSAAGVTMAKHLADQVFNDFGVSKSLIGASQDLNRATAETNRFTFDQNKIQPLTDAIDDAFTAQLASQYPVGEGVELIVKTLPFIQRDKAFELQKDQIDLANFTRKINEVRAQREPSLDPVEYGDEPVSTFSQVPYRPLDADELDLTALSTVTPAATPATTAVVVVDAEDEGEEGDRGGKTSAPKLRFGKTAQTEVGLSETPTRAHTLSQMRDHFSPEEEWKRTIVRDEQFTPKFVRRQRAIFKQQALDTLVRFERSQKRYLTIPEEFKRAAGVQWARAAGDDLAAEIFPTGVWAQLFTVTDAVREAAYVGSGTEATLAITGEAFSLQGEAARVLRGMDLAHIQFVNAHTEALLAENLAVGLEAGESTSQIAKRITDTFGTRRKDATRIARTEIGTAVQVAQVQGYEQTGVVEGKMWNTSLDGNVRDAHLIEGQTVGLDGEFTLGSGSRASAPLDPSLPPEDRIN